MATILLVDDEAQMRKPIRAYLMRKEYTVIEAETAQEAEGIIHSSSVDAAVLDYALPDGNALQLLAKIRQVDKNLPVIVLTGHGSIELAVQAIKEGAEQFLTKPVQLAALETMLERCLENQVSRQALRIAKAQQARESINPFAGDSAAIRALEEQAQRVARSDSPILILGPSGSGKGVLARWLHSNSARSAHAFVDLNCAGFSRELLETELFGHEKGAFTGAANTKTGLFEVAHRGTVFLDEVGDMDLAIQPKLLKVLEDKQFRRLGDVRDRRVDVRFIAATHRDLAQLVAEDKFRSDLYYRISTIPLRVPRLAERREDIPVLAQLFVEEFSRNLGRRDTVLTREALRKLQEYPWPGNVRELRNVIERAILLSDGGPIQAEGLLPAGASIAALRPSFGGTLEEVELGHIRAVLEEEGGSVARAAAHLGVSRTTLYQKIKTYKIPTAPARVC